MIYLRQSLNYVTPERKPLQFSHNYLNSPCPLVYLREKLHPFGTPESSVPQTALSGTAQISPFFAPYLRGSLQLSHPLLQQGSVQVTESLAASQHPLDDLMVLVDHRQTLLTALLIGHQLLKAEGTKCFNIYFRFPMSMSDGTSELNSITIL